MNFNIREKLLISASLIASAAALWHILCIFGGPSWFAFARAPKIIIESAQQGTVLAPVATLFVSGLMFLCSLFALSSTGLVRRLPLTRTALVVIASLCILRAIIAIPFMFINGALDLWQAIASFVWFYVGFCFSIGTLDLIKLRKTKKYE